MPEGDVKILRHVADCNGQVALYIGNVGLHLANMDFYHILVVSTASYLP